LVVVAVNVPDVDPAGIVRVAGRLTWDVALERLTTKSSAGAEFNVTVPVVVQPPVTVLGERLSELMDCAKPETAVNSRKTVSTALKQHCL
jgi:hypothetical protein